MKVLPENIKSSVKFRKLVNQLLKSKISIHEFKKNTINIILEITSLYGKKNYTTATEKILHLMDEFAFSLNSLVDYCTYKRKFVQNFNNIDKLNKKRLKLINNPKIQIKNSISSEKLNKYKKHVTIPLLRHKDFEKKNSIPPPPIPNIYKPILYNKSIRKNLELKKAVKNTKSINFVDFNNNNYIPPPPKEYFIGKIKPDNLKWTKNVTVKKIFPPPPSRKVNQIQNENNTISTSLKSLKVNFYCVIGIEIIEHLLKLIIDQIALFVLQLNWNFVKNPKDLSESISSKLGEIYMKMKAFSLKSNYFVECSEKIKDIKRSLWIGWNKIFSTFDLDLSKIKINGGLKESLFVIEKRFIILSYFWIDERIDESIAYIKWALCEVNGKMSKECEKSAKNRQYQNLYYFKKMMNYKLCHFYLKKFDFNNFYCILKTFNEIDFEFLYLTKKILSRIVVQFPEYKENLLDLLQIMIKLSWQSNKYYSCPEITEMWVNLLFHFNKIEKVINIINNQIRLNKNIFNGRILIESLFQKVNEQNKECVYKREFLDLFLNIFQNILVNCNKKTLNSQDFFDISHCCVKISKLSNEYSKELSYYFSIVATTLNPNVENFSTLRLIWKNEVNKVEKFKKSNKFFSELFKLTNKDSYVKTKILKKIYDKPNFSNNVRPIKTIFSILKEICTLRGFRLLGSPKLLNWSNIIEELLSLKKMNV